MIADVYFLVYSKKSGNIFLVIFVFENDFSTAFRLAPNNSSPALH